MARKLQINITDAQEESLGKYIQSQLSWEYDTVSRQNLPKPMFSSIEDWLEKSMAQVMAGPLSMFPSAEVEALNETIKNTQAEIQNASRLKVDVDPASPAVEPGRVTR
jgi:hypothetical protein